MQRETGTGTKDGNVVGILAMLASMACFTANDTLLKLSSSALPLGELIFLRNAVATGAVLVLILALGGFAWPRKMPIGVMGLRLIGEVGATLLYLTALVMMPIADITAIGQFTPLLLTAAAAVFLAEPVGWRRWLAAAVGLAGVLLIIRPGSSAFAPGAVFAIASIAFVVLRDLATRQLSAAVPTLLITVLSSAAVLVSSLALAPFETWKWPSFFEFFVMAAAGLILAAAYVLIIVAVRAGELSVVSPFRYSVMLFALFAGFAVWGDLPDALSLMGAAIVIGAGIYTFHREHVRGRDAARAMTRSTPL